MNIREIWSELGRTDRFVLLTNLAVLYLLGSRVLPAKRLGISLPEKYKQDTLPKDVLDAAVLTLLATDVNTHYVHSAGMSIGTVREFKQQALTKLPRLASALGEFTWADDVQVVSLAGSANQANWVANFQPSLRNCKLLGTRVHKGYRNFALLLADYIMDNNLIEPGVPTVFTGGSLGGVTAVLLSWYLQEQGYNIQAVYNIAGPRFTTDTSYGNILPVTTVANTLDPTCYLPLWPYKHSGRLVLIDPIDTATYDAHYYELSGTDSNKYLNLWRVQKPLEVAVHGHYPKYMERALIKLLGG